MILTPSDIRRITSLGYELSYFAEFRNGFYRLRNVDGHCVFLDVSSGKCKIYPHRPLGCRIYPVIYVEDIGPTIDKECPAANTITPREFILRAKQLMKLLKELGIVKD